MSNSKLTLTADDTAIVQSPSTLVSTANLAALYAAWDLANQPEDGLDKAAHRFGLEKKTAKALAAMTSLELEEIAEKFGAIFIFAAKNYNNTLYALTRDGKAENDVFTLARMSTLAASRKK